MYEVPGEGIGSEFHLPLNHSLKGDGDVLQDHIPEVPEDRRVFTSSGRASITLILEILKPSADDEILLPAYLCREALKPFLEKKVNVGFYRVDDSLRVDTKDLKNKVSSKTKAVLVIHYFGFPQKLDEINKICKENKVFLIEDCVQSPLTLYRGKPLGSFSDISFSSFRKWLPIADGSLLSVNNPELGIPAIKKNSVKNEVYVSFRRIGLKLKGIYRKTRIIPQFLFKASFRLADEFLSTDAVEMSAYSKRLLYGFDLKEVIRRRRKNFMYLLENLRVEGIKPLFSELPEGVCPIGFPILTECRDEIKKKLIRNRIYPPVHWNLPEEIDKGFKNSWSISKNILTIPIDQRYGRNEMKFIVDILKNAV